MSYTSALSYLLKSTDSTVHPASPGGELDEGVQLHQVVQHKREGIGV